MWMHPIFLLKNSGKTRFDHGAHGACFMMSRSSFAHLVFTAGVRTGSFFRLSIWAFVFTYGMLWIIDRITTVKVDEAGETAGLDMAIHGEAAYLEGI